MILIPYFWLFTQVISVSESVFIAFPGSNWTTADSVCTLPSIDKIKPNDLINVPTTTGGITEKAWTGTRVKYSKWAAFIGCDVEIFGSEDKSDIKRVQDCLLHCSKDTEASYFAVQNSKCKCLRDKPKSTTESLNCRKKCVNPMDTPCGSGISAMVFVITKDLGVKSEKYLENECVKATGDLKSYEVTNCSATLDYGCINTTGILTQKTWYEYQEECFKSDIVPKYTSVNIGSAQRSKFYWAPIFRTHLVLDGVNERNQTCLAIETSTFKYTIESCDSVYPFLCSKPGRRLKDQNGVGRSSLRFITLPISVVSAIGTLLIVVLLIIVIILTKFKMAKTSYEEKIRKLNERLATMQGSTYNEFEATRDREEPRYMYNELQMIEMTENSDGNYEVAENLDVPDDVSSNDQKMEETDYQGYLVPENQYHMINDNPTSSDGNYEVAENLEVPDDVSSNDPKMEETDYQDYLVPENQYHMINDNPTSFFTIQVNFQSNNSPVESTIENNDVNIYDEHGYVEPNQI